MLVEGVRDAVAHHARALLGRDRFQRPHRAFEFAGSVLKGLAPPAAKVNSPLPTGEIADDGALQQRGRVGARVSEPRSIHRCGDHRPPIGVSPGSAIMVKQIRNTSQELGDCPISPSGASRADRLFEHRIIALMGPRQIGLGEQVGDINNPSLRGVHRSANQLGKVGQPLEESPGHHDRIGATRPPMAVGGVISPVVGPHDRDDYDRPLSVSSSAKRASTAGPPSASA